MTPSIGIRLSVDGAARAEAALRQVQQSVGGLEAEVGGLSGSLGLAQKGLAAIGGAATLYAIGHYAPNRIGETHLEGTWSISVRGEPIFYAT